VERWSGGAVERWSGGAVETKNLGHVRGAGVAKAVEGQAQVLDGGVVAQRLGYLARSLCLPPGGVGVSECPPLLSSALAYTIAYSPCALLCSAPRLHHRLLTLCPAAY